MKNISKSLREKILTLTEEYYKETFKNSIIPGKNQIPVSGRVFDQHELYNLVDSSLDFWLTEGRYNDEFEKELSKFVNVNFTATVNSGSSANLLAFSALTSPFLGKRAIKKGDEVICAATSFPTTLNPVIQNGCVPVLLDVSIPEYNIPFRSIKKNITAKTKAIFLAHTLGNPYEVKELAEFCKKKEIWLIEDCCDALGALYDGKKVGSFGDLSTLSFYPAHQITCGEGGAVLTNSAILNKAVRSFRDWGRDCWCAPGNENTCGIRFNWKLGDLPRGYDHKYIYSHIGYNMKMTDMQSSIGLAQLGKIKRFVKKRNENHTLLTEKFKAFEKYFILPKATLNSNPSWFGFVLTVKKSSPFTRGELIKHLEEHKVASRFLFAGEISKQPAYKNIKFKKPVSLKNSKLVMNNTFWIGCYPAINKYIIQYIVKVFNDFLRQYEN